MCNNKYYDVTVVTLSLVAGIVLTLLGIFNILTAGILAPVLGVAFAALCLLLILIAAVSPLRQNRGLNRCLCQRAMRLLTGAALLLAVSAFALVFALTGLILAPLVSFLIYSIGVYTLISLYCFIACLIGGGCGEGCGQSA